MKKSLILLLFLAAGKSIMAQDSTQVSPAEKLAQKIATKMKDSLGLTDQQKNEVYTINMNLHDQKAVIWKKYINRDSIQVHLQRIENTRDFQYQQVLPDVKYSLYKQKKKEIVGGN